MKNDTEGMKLMSADGHEYTKEEIKKMLAEGPQETHHTIKKNYYYQDIEGKIYKYDDILHKGYYLEEEHWVYSKAVTEYLEKCNGEGTREVERIYYFNDSYPTENDHFYKVCESGLIGFAVGDALGVPFEFKTRTQMEQTPFEDMVEFGTHRMPMGTWSDDTSMTVATMASLIEKKKVDYTDVMEKFESWLHLGQYTATDKVFDVGTTVIAALDEYSVGKPPLECGRKSESSNGNGSLMRMFPVAFYIWKNQLSEEEATKLVNEYSSLTHANPVSQLGCKIYCDYIRRLMDGQDKYQAFYEIGQIDYAKYYPQEAVDRYSKILDGSIIAEPARNISGSGYVVDTLEASIWASFNSENYHEAVTKAINLGDDTDTVGAITGSIAGVMYGMDNIPNKWRNRLKKYSQLRRLASDFSELELNPEKQSQENTPEDEKIR